jgi:hypothetical protein
MFFGGALAAPAQTTRQTPSSTLPQPMQLSSSDQLKPHVGVRLGVATPSSDYNSGTDFGIEAGLQPYIPFGVGLELSHYTSPRDKSDSPDLGRTRLLARGTYNFGGDTPVIRYSWLGINAGPVFDDVGDSHDTRLAGGFLAGADFPLSGGSAMKDTVSLGAALGYLFVTDDPDEFSVNATAKYWF